MWFVVGVVSPSQQVDRKFIDNVAEAEAMEPGRGGACELRAQQDRQRAYLKRQRPGPGDAADSWRPRKRHRVAARNWLLHLDAQVLFKT